MEITRTLSGLKRTSSAPTILKEQTTEKITPDSKSNSESSINTTEERSPMIKFPDPATAPRHAVETSLQAAEEGRSCRQQIKKIPIKPSTFNTLGRIGFMINGGMIGNALFYMTTKIYPIYQEWRTPFLLATLSAQSLFLQAQELSGQLEGDVTKLTKKVEMLQISNLNASDLLKELQTSVTGVLSLYETLGQIAKSDPRSQAGIRLKQIIDQGLPALDLLPITTNNEAIDGIIGSVSNITDHLVELKDNITSLSYKGTETLAQFTELKEMKKPAQSAFSAIKTRHDASFWLGIGISSLFFMGFFKQACTEYNDKKKGHRFELKQLSPFIYPIMYAWLTAFIVLLTKEIATLSTDASYFSRDTRRNAGTEFAMTLFPVISTVTEKAVSYTKTRMKECFK